MTQDDAFLESILASPDDDGVRLIYADWLEDHGDEVRAQFIRLQIERARLPEDDPAQAQLEEREFQLLDEHERQWLHPFRRLLPPADTSPVFQRGFVSEVVFWGQRGARLLLDRAEELFHRVPLTALRLLPLGGQSGGPYPWDRRVKLEVDRLNLADLRALVARPSLGRLTLLDLSGATLDNPEGGAGFVISNALGDSAAAVLASSPHLRGLKTLLLRDNIIGDAGALALVASPHLARLTMLDLAGNRLSTRVIEEFQRRLGERVVL